MVHSNPEELCPVSTSAPILHPPSQARCQGEGHVVDGAGWAGGWNRLVVGREKDEEMQRDMNKTTSSLRSGGFLRTELSREDFILSYNYLRAASSLTTLLSLEKCLILKKCSEVQCSTMCREFKFSHC